MKKCYESSFKDRKEFDEIIEEYWQELSKGFYSKANFEQTKEFMWNPTADGYYVVVYRDSLTDEVVGLFMYSLGSPWWNNSLTILSEETTWARRKGYGITRLVRDFLNRKLEDNTADVITSGGSIPETSSIVDNVYSKKDTFKSQKIYYKTR